MKLLDFGLVEFDTPDATSIAGTRNQGERRVRGTPRYMAPEQILGSPSLDHRCDLYALGGVAYTLLTGHPPFEGSDCTRVMEAQVRAPIQPLRALRPEVPEDLERVVLRCLEKSPAARFADATELADALAACAVADEWDESCAADWWHANEPNATAPVD